jgi:hypothetical protein
MKATQTLLLIVVLVGLIGGVTFVRNWLATTKQSGPDPNGKPPRNSIEVPYPIAPVVTEQEVHSRGHHDFYFQVSSAEPVEVGVEWTSCKCAKVEVLTLASEEETGFQSLIQQWTDYQRKSRSAPYPDVRGLDTLLQKISKFLAQQKDDRWTVLASAEKQNQSVTLPGKSCGFFRLTWQNKNPGLVVHGSKIWQQDPGDPKTKNPDQVDLRIPLAVVQPLRVYPDKTVKVPDLNPNQDYSFEAVCWSSTRPAFKLLSVKEESGDPCFVTTVTPLAGEALQKAAELLEKEASARHVLSAYRIDVTIHERLPNNGKQLDLGLFHRKLIFATNQEDIPTLELAVEGVVRGDVTVGTESERDKIVLKTFPARKGKEVSVPLESNQPDMRLTIDSRKPDYLKVNLVERTDAAAPGRKRWDLRVTVPPNGPAGQLVDCYVKLKTNTERYIRIPVVGRATFDLANP